MKSIEELKQEQYDLKAKLHEVIEFTNSEEFFTLSPRKKSLIGQQRIGMEMYLNALTNRIYCDDAFPFDAGSSMLPLLFSMFSNSFSSTLPKADETVIKESDFEINDKSDE